MKNTGKKICHKYLVEIVGTGERYAYCGEKNGFVHWNPSDRWDAWDIKEYGFDDYQVAHKQMLKLKRMYGRNHYEYSNMSVKKFNLFLF